MLLVDTSCPYQTLILAVSRWKSLHSYNTFIYISIHYGLEAKDTLMSFCVLHFEISNAGICICVCKIQRVLYSNECELIYLCDTIVWPWRESIVVVYCISPTPSTAHTPPSADASQVRHGTGVCPCQSLLQSGSALCLDLVTEDQNRCGLVWP